jgi:hypothetical protein
MKEPMLREAVRSARALLALKLIHTAIWGLIAGCILALPLAAWLHRFDWAAGLAAITLLECLLLALNRGRCPLTNVANRLTSDRSPAFDIFLPAWLARYNKQIFGTLFLLNGLAALVLWLNR